MTMFLMLVIVFEEAWILVYVGFHYYSIDFYNLGKFHSEKKDFFPMALLTDFPGNESSGFCRQIE